MSVHREMGRLVVINEDRCDGCVCCRSLGGRLVTINSNEERTWLQTRIKELVEGQGQGFALEQWWTGGIRKGNGWVWQEDDHGQCKPLTHIQLIIYRIRLIHL